MMNTAMLLEVSAAPTPVVRYVVAGEQHLRAGQVTGKREAYVMFPEEKLSKHFAV